MPTKSENRAYCFAIVAVFFVNFAFVEAFAAFAGIAL
jgi:hypothetical protein